MEITIAINRYDRHVPFFNGTVRVPKGITLRLLEVGQNMHNRDGIDRHARMLNDLAFDVAEMSMSSYIMAVARDPNLPLVGVPAFPRRFFSMGLIYVNAKAGIVEPSDLIGRRVGLHFEGVEGLRAFQTTVSVLAKGDLKLEYGVPWEKIHWFCESADGVPIEIGNDMRIEAIAKGKDIGRMLGDGEIDAIVTPQPLQSMLERPESYCRLFADVHGEEVHYFRKYGFFPIVHVVVLKRELADKVPELPRDLLRMFEDAKDIAYTYYDDSNYSLIADTRMLYEQQRSELGTDPWSNGFKVNRKNVQQYIAYASDQRLISEPFPAERLFHPSTHDT